MEISLQHGRPEIRATSSKRTSSRRPCRRATSPLTALTLRTRFASLQHGHEVPFSVEEFGKWSREPEGFLEGRYPVLAGLIEDQGANFGELVRMWGFTCWSIEKAGRVLGYAPRYNFPEF